MLAPWLQNKTNLWGFEVGWDGGGVSLDCEATLLLSSALENFNYLTHFEFYANNINNEAAQ